MSRPLYIGLMSGTSMDGIDGVLVDLSVDTVCEVLGHVHRPFDPTLRERLFDLNRSGPDELHCAALASNGVAQAYAEVVQLLLTESGIAPQRITALGAHGQTVRHRPAEFDGHGYTCQLINGALLAELTGIDVVCDFRSRDVAAGGQGAPLVPAFHRAAFGIAGRDTAVLNVGGIANVSLLHADGSTAGHDCGPGNVLMDLWCQRMTGRPYDAAGAWAAQGSVSTTLLQQMLQEPFLSRRPPKSTGRDLFHAPWLDDQLHRASSTAGILHAVNVQATLTQFTAASIAQDIRRELPNVSDVLVCGGGALNTTLMQALRNCLPGVDLQAIHQRFRIDPMQVEAAAFAWLAAQWVARRPGNCTQVTGAKGSRVLGAMHPA